jgi:N-acetylglucosaminyl-diphospho-decaprenol L-rhamnosyltransferase
MDNRKARAGWGHGRPGSDAPEGAPLHNIVVSIINFRTPDMTIRCVDSVLAALEGVNGHVALVDNFSGDDSVARLRAYVETLGPDPRVTLVESPDNTGFSGGHNIGMRAARGRFYLIFNSDAELHPGAPEALLARAKAAPDAGLIGCRLEYDDGEVQMSCFRFPTIWSDLARTSGLSTVSRLLRRHFIALDMPPHPEAIDWMSFASILLRVEMVEAIGMMDEGFFMYSEDIEYCWRARQASWRAVHEPAACAIHHRGGSSEVKSQVAARKRVPAYFHASRTRLLATLYGPAAPTLANLGWHLGRALSLLRPLMGKPRQSVPEKMAGDIWINAFDPWGDRHHPEGPGR